VAGVCVVTTLVEIVIAWLLVPAVKDTDAGGDADGLLLISATE